MRPQPGVIKCPMCRAEAKELMECFRPAEWGAPVAERRAVVLRRIVAYNHRYGDRTTVRAVSKRLLCVRLCFARCASLPCVSSMQR